MRNPNFSLKLVTVIVLTVVFSITSCKREEVDFTPNPDSILSYKIDSTHLKSKKVVGCEAICGNCAKYVKCRVSKLDKVDLTSLNQKKKIINVTGAENVVVGYVGITTAPVPFVENGHVFLVKGVKKDKAGKLVSITVREGNWNTKCPSDRVIKVNSKDYKRILGYYDPNL